ncbi:MAG: EscU/YscU/HrcU family type III secretion system export apparatus switch protein [Aquificota bacterium]|nr:EscU/YscU/HrcU family type III secretion system export apparatus switch protein [Aquificota bacterium]
MAERKKAVALRYDPEKDRAPVVVAKGRGELADRIIEIAKREGIPVVENRDLIEALLRIEVFEEIPPQLYEAVARVLVFIRSIRSSPPSG